MKKVFNPQKTLSFLLWLIAVHSFFAGISIISLPENIFKLLGLNICTGDFFRYQGGVFHIVMSVAYAGAAFNLNTNRNFAVLCIITKFSAAIFLFLFYFLISKIWIVIFSGIGDLLMGSLVLILLIKFDNYKSLNSPV